MKAHAVNAKNLDLDISTFGDALKLLREERGFSHREVADRVGAKKALIKQWEQNTSIPSTVQLKRLYASFPQLRHFTHLLSDMSKRNIALNYEHNPDTSWVPPTADKDEPLPEEFTKKPDLPKTFGEALRRARVSEGLDHIDLADMLEVAQSTISRWERDKHLPVQDHYDKLCLLLPSLKAISVNVRDIPKPVGAEGMTFIKSASPTPPAKEEGASKAKEPVNVIPIRKIPDKGDIESVKPSEGPVVAAGAEYARALQQQQELRMLVASLRNQLKDAESNLEAATKNACDKHKALLKAAESAIKGE